MKIFKKIYEWGCDYPDALIVLVCSGGLAILGLII